MIEISKISTLPGVYIFKDKKGKVLYVGKAKNLKNRLRSYLNKEELDSRKARMMEKVKDLSYIVTSNEFEALVLEANLIKKYKPPFNILLRDDKSYPYLKISITEDWPKIEVVRKIKRDGNLYFGPYVPAQSMWEALSFIRRNFPIRTCKYNLNKALRPCIQFQMKRCPAPCAGKITKEEYLRGVETVIMFLKGQRKELLEKLRDKMLKLSNELKFEDAAKIRDQIKKLERIFEQQRVVSHLLNDMDVIGIYSNNMVVSVNILFIRNGVLVGSKDYLIKRAVYENLSDLTLSVIESLYSKEALLPPPIILLEQKPEHYEEIIKWLSEKGKIAVQIKTPEKKEERDILEMAIKNAKVHITHHQSPDESILNELKERLRLEEIPRKIGAFDVSTLFGTNSVGSFIYWEEGSFNKKYYRHLKVKETEGIDDYASMREIVLRIIKYFDIKDGIASPDIILIDGGKGHLNTALKVMNELASNLKVFAIAKEPDRVILPDGKEIYLEDKKPSSLLLKKIRDEAHRFAISYHKKLRKKTQFESILEKVPGIGKKRRLILLRKFGSLSKIKEASIDEIADLPSFNINLAKKVLDFLKN
ncbi:MAG: excinuclease ABC subunit UvrC [Thermodesulfovibrio sp.]|nr:excinuclease ABC subunit UvrC [Thermodesulfovibrio sp.]